MSASLVVDLNATTIHFPSIIATGAGSGLAFPGSGSIIGQSVDLINANTFCNVYVGGQAVTNQSGQLRVAVQTAPADVSGQYTDPTSGLAVLPTWFSSGGILILNSGGVGLGTLGAQTSGQSILSGFFECAAFQRPQRYARLITISGDLGYAGPLQAGFISNLKLTGSGGGFSLLPGSGSVSV